MLQELPRYIMTWIEASLGELQEQKLIGQYPCQISDFTYWQRNGTICIRALPPPDPPFHWVGKDVPLGSTGSGTGKANAKSLHRA